MFDRAYRITARPGEVDRLLTVLHANAQASRDEPGIRFFEVMRSDDDPDVALVVERYASADAYEAHRQTEHFKAWSAAKVELVESMEPFTGATE